MHENVEYKGKWKLPGSERNWDGTLKFRHDEAITLDLDGFFGEDDNYFEILLGVTNKGEKITVLNANRIGTTLFPNAGNEIRAFDCELMLIGAHFNRLNEIQFKKVYLNPTYLTEWMLPPKTFLEDLLQKEPGAKKEKIYHIKDKGINKEVILESLKSKLIFNSKLRTFGDWQKTCEFKYVSYLIVEPESPRGLDWFLDLNDNLCNFLTLMTRHPVYSNSLGGEIGENSIVSIYFIISEPKVSKNISWHDIDIKFSDLDQYHGKSYIELCINKWLEKMESLKSVYELFHMISYIPVMYKETYFLTIMQALEAYYGQAYEEHIYLKRDEWKQKRDKLIDSIPKDLDERLKENIANRIKYANSYSLKTKIKILFKDGILAHLIRAYYDFGDDKIKKICDTRDYLTHHGDDYVDKILKKEELDEVNEILNISLRILIFKEIGVPDEIIWDLFSTKIRWLRYHYGHDF